MCRKMLVDTSIRMLFSSARAAPLENDNDSSQDNAQSPDHGFSLDCGRELVSTSYAPLRQETIRHTRHLGSMTCTSPESQKLSETRTVYMTLIV
jgi:hypothetical protein